MWLWRKIKNTKGTAAIEFALIVPMLFLVLSGIFNFGLILIKKNQLNSVINAGVLYSIRTPSNTSNIQNKMTSATSISPLTSSVTSYCACSGTVASCSSVCGDGSAPSSFVTMTASSTVALYALDFVLTNPFPISTTATIRVG